MDTIREYVLEGKSGEQYITIPKNSRILSARKASLLDNINIGVLVDLDTDEMIETCLLIFAPEDQISDDMKANFIGVVTLGVESEKQFYVFEKLT